MTAPASAHYPNYTLTKHPAPFQMALSEAPDLAVAHVAALALLLNGDSGGAFNLGTGVGYSVRQILEAIQTETGQTVPVVVRERRAGDPPVLVADPSNAEKRLGFTASRSELLNIIRSAWAWKAHPRGQ